MSSDNSSLTPIEASNIASMVHVTDTDLTFVVEPSFEEWSTIVGYLQRAVEVNRWRLAGAIEYGAQKFGDKYTQAIDETRLAYGTLANLTYVYRQVPSINRRSELSVSHHYEVAALTLEEQRAWLDAAVENKWSRSDLRYAISHAKVQQEVASEDGRYVLPINPASAVWFLLDWIDGRVKLTKEEVKKVVLELMKEESDRRKTNDE